MGGSTTYSNFQTIHQPIINHQRFCRHSHVLARHGLLFWDCSSSKKAKASPGLGHATSLEVSLYITSFPILSLQVCYIIYIYIMYIYIHNMYVYIYVCVLILLLSVWAPKFICRPCNILHVTHISYIHIYIHVIVCHNTIWIGAKLKSVRLCKTTRKHFSFHLIPLGVEGHRIN